MDAKLKTEWVNALRSGKYRQAKQTLRSGGAFCCLGVLCRVAHIPIGRDGGTVAKSVGGDYRPIAAILGVQTMHELMGMNDQGSSFHAIANHIEKYL